MCDQKLDRNQIKTRFSMVSNSTNLATEFQKFANHKWRITGERSQVVIHYSEQLKGLNLFQVESKLWKILNPNHDQQNAGKFWVPRKPQIHFERISKQIGFCFSFSDRTWWTTIATMALIVNFKISLPNFSFQPFCGAIIALNFYANYPHFGDRNSAGNRWTQWR